MEDSNTTSPLDLDYFTQHWVRSYEEEPTATRVQIYRPEQFKAFPPSRFRMQYIFERDGTCQWFYLAPTDGHHFRDGRWRVASQEKDVIHIEQGEQTNVYRVLELTQDVLRIEPIAE